MTEHVHTNALIHETSPYLLQHAHNPVDWMPWSRQAFDKAEKEHKLVIIGVGYSSCHWCHVMEHETFEDSAAAALMNEHFISIKVDREERPDIDQVYMTAVQLMTGQGGWPMNVVALPDGRPVWGGTYFPRQNWMQALSTIWKLYRDDPQKVLEYAGKLTKGVQAAGLIKPALGNQTFTKDEIEKMVSGWKNHFDSTEGGSIGAPKFPMPGSQLFLLQYGTLSKDREVLDQLNLTLNKMAFGGIFDQVGGGFARYSTDELWKVPHFEKMLYDNAQLVSLYSKAYQKFKDPLYQQIVQKTLDWISREMSGKNGEFFSALDADSEGEEGKFYVWTLSQLQNLIPKGEWDQFSDYYDLKKGKWEGNKIILVRNADSNSIDPNLVEKWNKTLLEERNKRVHPALDDKALTSWNALMITAYINAYKAFQNEDYLHQAQKNAEWILNKQVKTDSTLWHSYRQGQSSVDGLIEDYAFAGQAFLELFEVTFDEKYLNQAGRWIEYAQNHFEDTASGLYFTRSKEAVQLISKSMEISDNVIPASNSVMAQNLFLLSHYLDKAAYREQAQHMLVQVKQQMEQYAEGYYNWASLALQFAWPAYEVAVVGNHAHTKYLKMQHYFLPNITWIGSQKESTLPLLQNRFVADKTFIYVCQDKACKLPEEDVEKALKLIKY